VSSQTLDVRWTQPGNDIIIGDFSSLISFGPMPHRPRVEGVKARLSKEKPDLKAFTLEELESFIRALGQPRYRAAQIYSWIHKGVKEFEQMTDLPRELRELLANQARIGKMEISEVRVSRDGTRKYLLALEDGNAIEAVSMEHRYGWTACISTQIGCRMGCRFCASTIGGIVRDLTAGEMLEQVLVMQGDLGRRVSNIVLMGSGEPLENYDETMKFLEIVNHPRGINVGMRRITLSTCGIAPAIRDLADRRLQITLAVSLHAPNDELRDRIVPVNRRYPLRTLLDACRYYTETTGRRVTFEYALIEGLNDSLELARELGRVLRDMLCHVNLIPVNPVDDRPYRPPTRERVHAFQNILQERGIPVTIRRSLGGGIDAACGQLRRRHLR